VKQDEQIDNLEKLRTRLDNELAKLITSLEELKDEALKMSTTNDLQVEQLASSKTLLSSVELLSTALQSRTEKLELQLKEQERLIFAIKSFLEEKATKELAAVDADGDVDGKATEISSPNSWPTATVPAAYLTVMLLSHVVSNIATSSLVRPKPVSSHVQTDTKSLDALPQQTNSSTLERQLAPLWISEWDRSQSLVPIYKGRVTENEKFASSPFSDTVYSGEVPFQLTTCGSDSLSRSGGNKSSNPSELDVPDSNPADDTRGNGNGETFLTSGIVHHVDAALDDNPAAAEIAYICDQTLGDRKCERTFKTREALK
jgi:hypothetical protein